jgi:N-acetylneuraminate synthase/sialic acid synthase
MRSFTIAGREITQESDMYVIAEIGNNHQGDVEICKKMMKKAHFCGADALKLQKKDIKSAYTQKLLDSPYDNANSFGATYGEHKYALEFSEDEYMELVDYAYIRNLTLFATAFDINSAYFLEKCGTPVHKTASGCLSHSPLIEVLAGFNKPIIISTGGWGRKDIDRVYDFLKQKKASFCFLYCIASYPNKTEEMHLSTIKDMMERYPDIIIGLSDHHPGIKTAVGAYYNGARIIEKHFTLDRSAKGPDHSFSLEPTGLEKLCEDLKDHHRMQGIPKTVRFASEEKPIKKMSNAIYAARVINAGETIGKDDIAIKIPADGLEPYHYDEIIGKTTKVCLLPETPIMADMLEKYST